MQLLRTLGGKGTVSSRVKVLNPGVGFPQQKETESGYAVNLIRVRKQAGLPCLVECMARVRAAPLKIRALSARPASLSHGRQSDPNGLGCNT